MRKIKMTFSLLIIIFVALLIYQNREYCFTKQALSLSLGVETWHWTAPAVANVYYMGGCFIIGLIITGYMGLGSKLRAKKTIKKLNATIDSHQELITSLKSELATFKNDPYQKIEDQSETEDIISMDEEIKEELPEETKKNEKQIT